MEINRIGSQPNAKGSAEYFIGTVRIYPLFQANDPARAIGASVTFEPGARTPRHTHPLGQALSVTAGCRLGQRSGGSIEQIRPGDAICAGPEALARCHGNHGYDAHRHCGTARRQDRGLDGKGQRRTIPGTKSKQIGASIHVQRQSLLRSQCNITASLRHDRTARSNRT
ncbi:hypothetical protein [Microcoleus vaginatus]|uniref:hypothetical protein n=1 Tax=Microcoleus vaginatus TaxID=119532 RepID=UPI00403F2471